jgi:hypothetical protein
VAQAKEQKTLSQAQMNELLKLRGQKGQTQTALQELAKAQAANRNGAASPFMTNAMQMGLGWAKKGAQTQARAKLARMKDQLHLTDDQAQAIDDIMQRHIEEDSQRSMAILSGQKPSVNTGAPSEDSEIQSMLTPDQLAAWPDFQQSEHEVSARGSAEAEVALMKTTVDLTPDQQSKAEAALYQYELDQKNNSASQRAQIAKTRAQGDLVSASAQAVDMMKQHLADKMKALDGILTPDQLKEFQQSQMSMIDFQASAIKMFMPATNTTPSAE